MENTIENLDKLVYEHENMLLAYAEKVIRPKEEKFHLEQALVAMDKLLDKLPGADEKKFRFQLLKEMYILQLGTWFIKNGNLKEVEERFNQVRKKIGE